MGTDGGEIATNQGSGDTDTTDDSDANAWAEQFEQWKQSVETRFSQVGEAFASLGGGESGGESAPTQPGATPAPKTKRAAAAAPVAATSAAQGDTSGEATTDAKQPQSTHFWFRDAPWKRAREGK